jgi:inositol phosphorylceramide mannosyltransferase catalytic subunit
VRKHIYCTIFWVTTCVFVCGSSIQEQYPWPDFEKSLGKGDPYFDMYYGECFTSLKKPTTEWGRLETNSSKELHEFINFCRRLYETKRIDPNPLSGATRIPRIVHQIWLGSRLPEKYKRWQKGWQSMSGWQYKLWTDEDIRELELVNEDLYLFSKNYGQRSDIARIEILNKFGGLYVDVDFECLNPQFFTMLNKIYDFYTGMEPLDVDKFSINNALLASIPGHPILKGYIKELRNRWHIQKSLLIKEVQTQRALNFAQGVVFRTGPGFFTLIVKKYADTGYKDIIFPPSFFYPLGIDYRVFLPNELSERALRKAILRPESAAIHWWGGSWHEASAFVRHQRLDASTLDTLSGVPTTK